MATVIVLLVCASFGLMQILIARRSRRYLHILDRDDFIFQRRSLAKGVRRNSAVLMSIGVVSATAPLLLALHSQAEASPRLVSRHADGQHSLHLAESLGCVPSSPSDGVCS